MQIVAMATVEVPELLGRMGGDLSVRTLVVDPPMGLSVVQVGDSTFEGDMLVEMRSVLGEIAVNARRHGQASSLVIAIEHGQAGWRIRCEDDGRGMSEGASPGLGSRLLDETVARYGGSWSLEPGERGCRVVIDLPAAVIEPALASSVS